jgi:hypothetical protein
MAWGNSQRDLVVSENSAMKREIELLREFMEKQSQELSDLKVSLVKTQEALIAKESPIAYFDQKSAEAAATPLTPEQQKAVEKFEEGQRLLEKYAEEVERPHLFLDADDMEIKLMGAIFQPEDESLHGDGES